MNEDNQTTSHRTCLVTIVQPGYSDAVIKLFPAEHEKEKIWLDTRPGVERWEAVKTLMRRFSAPGKHVPEPVRWHNVNAQDPASIVTPVITDADIPVVELQGFVFQPLPEPQTVSRPKEDAQSKINERMDRMENRIDALIGAISKATEQKAIPAVAEVHAGNGSAEPVAEQSHRRPGRPRKEA